MSADGQILGPPVVEAIDIHHHYGEGPQRTDVLFDINMHVREGELDTELRDGRTFKLLPGMSYQVADGAAGWNSSAKPSMQ